jgi:hypothetical protein
MKKQIIYQSWDSVKREKFGLVWGGFGDGGILFRDLGEILINN